MRRSITNRIIISYIGIILAVLIFLGVFFSIAAGRYVEFQANKDLINDFNVLNNAIKKASVDEADTIENKIKNLIREVNGLKAVESRWAIVVTPSLKVLYPKNMEQQLKNQVIPQIRENILKAVTRRRLKIKIDGTNYLAIMRTLEKGTLIDSNAVVVLYTPIEPIQNLVKGIFNVLLILMTAAGIVAVVTGIVVARTISKPIIALKNRAQMISKRDFDTNVEIDTGDELEELANTLNSMAKELKEYDIAQKRFLQNASHELKTPLMSIQGYAEGIKDKVFDDNNQALDVIVEESKRLKNIVEELIFLSKLETMGDFYKFTNESINEIVEKSVGKLSSIAIKNDIKVNTMLYKNAYISVDKDKLTQALINIIGNCLRHAASEVSIITSNDGKCFEIKVFDDGEGFSDKEIKTVFQRFSKGKKGDTGLGLAITKVIIEKHHGSIEVSNRSEGGAEFILKLPI